VVVVEGGVDILIAVQPRASRTRVVGEHGGMLKVQLAAPPVDGEANAALVELIADALRVPKRQVSITSGQTGRKKRVRVMGVQAAAVESTLR